MYKMKKEKDPKLKKKLEKQARYKINDFRTTIKPMIYKKSTRKTQADLNLDEIRGAREFLTHTYQKIKRVLIHEKIKPRRPEVDFREVVNIKKIRGSEDRDAY